MTRPYPKEDVKAAPGQKNHYRLNLLHSASPGEIGDGTRGDDGGDGVLINEFLFPLVLQDHGEIIETAHQPPKLETVDKMDRDRRSVLTYLV